MAKEQLSIYHHNGGFSRKNLNALGLKPEEMCEYQEYFTEEPSRPDSVFLDLFFNRFELESASLWWRAVAPEKLNASDWLMAAFGYAKAMQLNGDKRILLIDLLEKDLLDPNVVEAIAAIRMLQAQGELNILFICWSASLTKSWQTEGMDEASSRIERMQAFWEAQKCNSYLVPVTDPLASLICADKIASTPRELSCLILPVFQTDKLETANWFMNASSRFEQALKGVKND